MNKEPLNFKTKEDFKAWLRSNRTEKRAEVFIYKKGYAHLGITYEEAVQAALCYGWIDSVTRSYDDEKFIQAFTPRNAKSNWSLSNIKRMKLLIEAGEMTSYGLRTFDATLLDRLEDLIAAEASKKTIPVTLPEEMKALLVEAGVIEEFEGLSPSHQWRYLDYILDVKNQATSMSRVQKVINTLKGEKKMF